MLKLRFECPCNVYVNVCKLKCIHSTILAIVHGVGRGRLSVKYFLKLLSDSLITFQQVSLTLPSSVQVITSSNNKLWLCLNLMLVLWPLTSSGVGRRNQWLTLFSYASHSVVYSMKLIRFHNDYAPPLEWVSLLWNGTLIPFRVLFMGYATTHSVHKTNMCIHLYLTLTQKPNLDPKPNPSS
jgi:hypothetical protein